MYFSCCVILNEAKFPLLDVCVRVCVRVRVCACVCVCVYTCMILIMTVKYTSEFIDKPYTSETLFDISVKQVQCKENGP